MQCAEGHTIGVEELQWLNGLFTARFAEQVVPAHIHYHESGSRMVPGVDDETVC